jgi:hypothetical protein
VAAVVGYTVVRVVVQEVAVLKDLEAMALVGLARLGKDILVALELLIVVAVVVARAQLAQIQLLALAALAVQA